MTITAEIIAFTGLCLGLFISMWRIRTWFSELRLMLEEEKRTILEIDHKIDSHEKTCQERHRGYEEKFKNLNDRIEAMREHINNLYKRTEGK